VRAEIRAELDGRMHAMSILAREWQDRLLPRRGEWESDVRLVLSQSPGLQSIAWLDAGGEHSWAYPPDAEQPAIDLDKLRGQGMRRAVILGPVLPRDGRPRIRILAPLFEDKKASGWLAATYDSRELFREILATVDSTFPVEVTAGGVDLYRAQPKAEGDAPRPISHTELTLPGDLTIQIGVEPSPEIMEAAHSRLPLAILGGGVALSVLMTIALFLRNVAADRAGALEVEVAGHERAEAEVRRLNTELEERVQQRTAQLERSNGDLQRFASFLSTSCASRSARR
jgi:sensor domain CHASE-containing protein